MSHRIKSYEHTTRMSLRRIEQRAREFTAFSNAQFNVVTVRFHRLGYLVGAQIQRAKDIANFGLYWRAVNARNGVQ